MPCFSSPGTPLGAMNLCVWRKTGGHCNGDSGGRFKIKLVRLIGEGLVRLLRFGYFRLFRLG
jgi:hypothetical protein